jgi:type I restriction enzyme S subunit
MRDGWTETKLGEVAEWFSGGTPRAGEARFYEDGTIPWVVIADMLQTEIHDTATRITPAGHAEIGDRLAPVGSVLISMYATVGRAAYAHIPVATNQAIAWSVPDSKKIDSRFLLYVAQSLEPTISSMARGATQRNINRAMLKEFAFNLPPLAEQKRIVDVVSSVDTYIDSLQSQVDAARTARNAVLHELLSAGGDDWTETALGDLSNISYGYTESATVEIVGPKFLRITDIQDSSVDWDLVPYCRIDTKQLEKQRLANGDIVFARTGATTGKSFLLQNPPEAVCASYLIRLRPKVAMVIPYFLNLNFQTAWYWSQVRSGTTGSAQGGFNASKLAAVTMNLPPLAEQKRIVDVVSSMDEVIHATESTLSEANCLRSGLLSDLLSGEHEIPDLYDRFLGAA